MVGGERDTARLAEEGAQLDPVVFELAVEDRDVGRPSRRPPSGSRKPAKWIVTSVSGCAAQKRSNAGATRRRVSGATYPTVSGHGSVPAARVARMACSAPASSGRACSRGFARSGQLDAVGIALHELRSDARLELADLAAERLLGEVQPLGGAGEVELLGERQQRPQMPHLDVHGGTVCPRDSGWCVGTTDLRFPLPGCAITIGPTLKTQREGGNDMPTTDTDMRSPTRRGRADRGGGEPHPDHHRDRRPARVRLQRCTELPRPATARPSRIR